MLHPFKIHTNISVFAFHSKPERNLSKLPVWKIKEISTSNIVTMSKQHKKRLWCDILAILFCHTADPYYKWSWKDIRHSAACCWLHITATSPWLSGSSETLQSSLHSHQRYNETVGNKATLQSITSSGTKMISEWRFICPTETFGWVNSTKIPGRKCFIHIHTHKHTYTRAFRVEWAALGDCCCSDSVCWLEIQIMKCEWMCVSANGLLYFIFNISVTYTKCSVCTNQTSRHLKKIQANHILIFLIPSMAALLVFS